METAVILLMVAVVVVGALVVRRWRHQEQGADAVRRIVDMQWYFMEREANERADRRERARRNAREE